MKIINNDFIKETDLLGNGSIITYTGAATSYAELPFAKLENKGKILCSYRYKMWFCEGKTVDSVKEIPYESQWLCVKNEDGGYTVLYALCDEPIRASFFGYDDNTLGITIETGEESVRATEKICVYAATGNNFYALIDNASKSIAKALKTCTLAEDKPIPEFMKYFGWCTWDSFYEKVSENDVINGLEAFKKGGFTPKFLLLDDGWQTVCEKYNGRGEYKLSSFRPNKKFGFDLSNLTSVAKEKYGVKQFYVWHALLGYWGGVEPNSFEMRKYRPKYRMLKFSPSAHKVHPDVPEFLCGTPECDKLFEFYNDYHKSLAEQGVDGVKVDVQFNSGALGEENGGRVRMTRKCKNALEASVNLNFKGGLINCMSGSNDLTYFTKASNVTRTSDDFFPNDSESHGKHIFNNAINSLWIGGFTRCDWDMFQTKHKYGEFHAAARAVSGSPVYVSDKVDEHNFEIIKKLTTSDGKLLLAEKTARPTEDSLFLDMSFNEIFKIFNYNKFGGVIAAFNLSNKDTPLKKGVRPRDIEGCNDGKYAVYSHNKKKFFILSANEEINVTLSGVEFDIFTVMPIKDGRAVFGLTDKYNSGASVYDMKNFNGDLYLTLSGGGAFAMYSEKKPRKILIDGRDAEFSYNDFIVSLEFESDEASEISVIY